MLLAVEGVGGDRVVDEDSSLLFLAAISYIISSRGDQSGRAPGDAVALNSNELLLLPPPPLRLLLLTASLVDPRELSPLLLLVVVKEELELILSDSASLSLAVLVGLAAGSSSSQGMNLALITIVPFRLNYFDKIKKIIMLIFFIF